MIFLIPLTHCGTSDVLVNMLAINYVIQTHKGCTINLNSGPNLHVDQSLAEIVNIVLSRLSGSPVPGRADVGLNDSLGPQVSNG